MLLSVRHLNANQGHQIYSYLMIDKTISSREYIYIYNLRKLRFYNKKENAYVLINQHH